MDSKKLTFTGLSALLEPGMADFAEAMGFSLAPGGIRVDISINEADRKIVLRRSGSTVQVQLSRPHQIFRAVTLLLQKPETDYTYTEPVMLDTCGLMVDGSQASSLWTPEVCKRMLRIIAGMGYNMFMLYLEDCYDVPGEPYFGYMRPRYSEAELRELDEYASHLGIEMIPCIETLGHLTEALKRYYPYGEFRDDPSTLLVGDERTYVLIEKMIRAASAPFKTRRIHLGLDEAFLLGQGKYLLRNGYRPKTEIMREHVKRVGEIAERLGLSPMMWGDMFFRARSRIGDFYDPAVVIPDSAKDELPSNIQPIYWDYYHTDPNVYRRMIAGFRKLSDHIIFAEAARNGFSFGAHHSKYVATVNAAMPVCKEAGIREAFITVWGDDHKESDHFATLPDLLMFAEHAYSEGTPDEKVCAERFSACVGADWNAFLDISGLDEIPGYNAPNLANNSPSRALIWQDVLLGIVDGDLRGFDFEPHYRALKERFDAHAADFPAYRDMFLFYRDTAAVLELKGSLGLKLADAYAKRDLAFLREAKDVILPELIRRMEDLRLRHRHHFFALYKPVGWEILDIRYGGALARLHTAKDRLTDYLEGRIDRLVELEEPRLSYDGQQMLPVNLRYQDLCSASRL